MMDGSGVRFEPWCPPGDDPRYRGVRLLVLGESHYEEPELGLFDDGRKLPRSFTQKVLTRHALTSDERQKFFANTYSLITGEDWFAGVDTKNLWNSVFFYNYTQRLAPKINGSARPTAEMWKEARAPFLFILEQIRPEALLVLGKTMWKKLPTEDAAGDYSAPLMNVSTYRLKDGFEIFATQTQHPSRAFKVDDWRPKLQSFLDFARAHRN